MVRLRVILPLLVVAGCTNSGTSAPAATSTVVTSPPSTTVPMFRCDPLITELRHQVEDILELADRQQNDGLDAQATTFLSEIDTFRENCADYVDYFVELLIDEYDSRASGGRSWAYTLMEALCSDASLPSCNRLPATTTTSTVPDLPPYTVDEFRAALEPAAVAWILKPSAALFDELSAVATVIWDSLRPLPVITTQSHDDVLRALDDLTSYPGHDNIVIRDLELLREWLPGLPTVLYDGVYEVGVDIEPGKYRVLDVSDCYWERLDDAGEILDNNFISGAPQALVTVRSSDFAVNFDGCGPWVKIN